jgi:hypothetical protein
VKLRTLIPAALAVAVVGLALVAWHSPAQSQPGAAAPPTGAAKQPAQALPISHVVLFSSGVGYFEREGDVEGNAKIDLAFPVTDVNDLLKSLVLQDLGGGQVSAVNYDSHEPIEKTLRSFALNLTGSPTLGQLLSQARGEKVEAILPANASLPTVIGVIVGVEVQRQAVDKDRVVEVEMLNLLAQDGLRAVPLAQVQRLRFLNPVIDAELRRALEVLAQGHDTQKKTVSLAFSGNGKRPVKVGYVVENPIWKTSYRLVLPKNGAPFLQGWAVVENTSDEDWSNVRMALVSGRPISYQMDLYSPLYIPRPTVEPELFASLRPPTYGGSMDNPGGQVAQGVAPQQAPLSNLGVGRFSPPMVNGGVTVNNSINPGNNAQFGNSGLVGNGVNPDNNNFALQMQGQNRLNFDEFQRRQAANRDNAKRVGEQTALNLKAGVTSAASAESMGDFFQYTIDQKVTLPRQKSALLPIVTKEVEAARVSIYNEAVHGKYPLLGLKFKNTTGLNLMQGPLTVFDGNSYAGDGRLADLQPKEERLVSYAIDLGTEVKADGKAVPDELTATKIVKGVVHASYKLRTTRTYRVNNRNDQERTLILEHPIRPEWKLLSPEKPTERSRDVYRFEVKVAAGKAAVQDVIEEHTRTSTIALTNLDDQTTQVFLRSPVTGAKVKEALEKAVTLRNKWNESQRQLTDATQQLEAIRKDQDRLRSHVKDLPPTSNAYKRALEKLDQQEAQIDQLEAAAKQYRAAAEQQRKDYEGFLANLNVE